MKRRLAWMAKPAEAFLFSPENFRRPQLPVGLGVRQLPALAASDETLRGLGHLVRRPEDFSVEQRSFEITPWPQPGWRKLDPGTGDEAQVEIDASWWAWLTRSSDLYN